MNDATSVPDNTDTQRWTRVRIEREGILVDTYGPLVCIDTGDDIVKVTMSEALALADDIVAAVAQDASAQRQQLRRPVHVDEDLARLDDGGLL